MLPNILNTIKGYFTPNTISRVSLFLGESETNVNKALSGVVPSVLSGFIDKANAGSGHASDLLDFARNAYAEGTEDSRDGFSGRLINKGSGIVQSLFDDRLGGVLSSIASFAGIKKTSAGTLFSLTAPLVASAVGKQVVENNLAPAQLVSLLNNQKSRVQDMLPSGLSSITGLLGFSKASDTIRRATDAATDYSDKTIATAKGGINWLLWLLTIGLILIALWYFFGRGCNKTEVMPPETTLIKPVETFEDEVKGMVDSIGNFIYDIGSEMEMKLKDGTVLKVGDHSTEAKLFKMLDDADFMIDTVNKSKNWVVLDRVYFESGKAILTASSLEQIKNIGSILKNFPGGSIKLGGYTDNTGDAHINNSVSEERAKAVAQELIKYGAAPEQVKEAVGYGAEFPVCPANDTPECKAQNRRVDLKVASK